MKEHSTHLSHPKYRPDIDGLRAVAVLSVVAFHAFPSWVKGGFIGVDIFFVISGYLISTIIFENLDKGAFSFAEFYSRRIKRIFPALLLVLVASYTFGWFALFADEFKQLSKHIAAGAGFISNIVLWNEAGYFDNLADTKPLLHLWSLGIEEQFYFIWPLLLWISWKRKFNLLTVTTLVAAISFWLNLKGVKEDSIATFYSPQTRFWELLCGSLLAWVTLYKKGVFSLFKIKLDGWLTSSADRQKTQANNNYKKLNNILSIFGLCLLAYGFWKINTKISFPGIWAAIPVLSAVLIIFAGSKTWVNHTILSNKIVVWFGLISFPLYLWHWPLLSFARIFESEIPSVNIRISAIIIAIIFAWLTYKFIESPIRIGQHGYAKAIVLAIFMAMVGLGSYVSFKNNRISDWAAKTEAQSRQIGATIRGSLPEQSTWCHERFQERREMVSMKPDINNFCELEKDSTPNVLLVGDSMNYSIFHGLNGVDGVNVLVLAAGEAAPLFNIRTADVNNTDRHLNYKLTNQSLEYALNADNIKVVVMSFLYGPAITNPDSSFKIINMLNLDDKDPHHIFTKALSETLSKLLARNKKVIYLLPNPILTYDIKSCLSSYRPFRLTKKNNTCSQSYNDYLNQGGQEYREWVSSVLKNFPQVKIFDLASPLCDEKTCWGMRDGVVLYKDFAHLSNAGSDFVASFLIPLIRDSLETHH